MNTVTIKDIARMAGVSIATVSRTLNGGRGVSQETRTRILELCYQHGYRTNLLARGLSASRAGLIGCVISDLDNPLFSETALILEQLARQQGYHVLFCHGRAEDRDIGQVFDFLIGHRVDGIILVSSSKQAPALIGSYLSRVPIVLQGAFESADGAAAIQSVCVDNYLGGRMAAEYLHSLGHRRIVCLGGRQNNCSHYLRLKGFTETARQLGLAVRALPNTLTNSSTVSVGYALAKKFFIEDFQETAMFAVCDTVALGVMAAAKEFCVSIPDDLSLLGFDNIQYSDLPNIHLTTLDHQISQVMAAALDRLLSRIGGDAPAQPQPMMIPPVLCRRNSCRARA